MSFHQSLEDILSAQDLDDREYHSDTERPASTPPHAHSDTRHAAHRQEVNLDEQVVPSLRAQDLAGRIRSYQGLLWRRNAKGRASRGWTRAWFKVAPGRSTGVHAYSLFVVAYHVENLLAVGIFKTRSPKRPLCI